MARKVRSFFKPIPLVVLMALIVAAGLIAASQLSAQWKQRSATGAEAGSQAGSGIGAEAGSGEEEAQAGGESSPSHEAVLTEQPVKGNPDAPVVIVEFAEFYCPFCARYLWETYPKIEEEYIDRGLVRYEFRNLVVHGAVALLAAVAGECAHEQGKFWAFHDRLFESVFPGRNIYKHEQLDLDDLKELARGVGLDLARFSRCLEGFNADYNYCLAGYNRCMEEGEARERCAEGFSSCLGENRMMQKILEDRRELQRLIEELPPEEREQAQRIGTPTFFINGHILVGAQPFAKFKQMIDRELERAKAQGGDE